QTTEPYFDEIKINFEDGTSQTITKKTPQAELQNLGFGNVPMLIQKDPQEIITVPYFKFKNRSFAEEMTVEIKSLNPEDKIQYLIEEDGSDNSNGKEIAKDYSKPILIKKSATIKAFVVKGENQSKTVSAHFHKRPHNYSIQIKSKVHPLYTADTPEALLDGIKGTENWRKGDWQGYQGTDFEAVIDLKKPIDISMVSANFLQDARPWILTPKNFKVY